MRTVAKRLIALFSILLLGASMAQASPPANDYFINRITISDSSGNVDATNVDATLETGEVQHVAGIIQGKSVWWQWTAPGAGQVTFSTCGSSFDTLLAAYTGNTISTLVKVASNNDFCGTQSSVSFDVVAGTNYKIAVAGIWPASGDISLSWDLRNDNFKLEAVDFNPAAPDPAQPGSPLALSSWRIKGVTTTKPVWLELFASKTGGFTLSRFGGTITNSHVLNGFTQGTQTATPSQTLNWLPDGIYTIVGFANRPGTGGPTESNYADNWAPLAGKRLRVRNTQTPISNLVLQNPTFTRNGTAISVTGTVRNTGSSATPAYGFWIETAYGSLSAEGNFTQEGYIAGGVKVGALAPNGVYNYSQTGTAPLRTTLAIMADSTDVIPETEERDNWKYNGFLPPACGTNLDLGILNASIAAEKLAPTELDPAGTVTVSFNVINRSSVTSDWVWIEFFASETGGLSTIRSGVPLFESKKISIPANSTSPYTIPLYFEAIPDGIYSVVGVINRCGVADNPGDSNPYGANGDNLYRLPGRVILKNPATPKANLRWESHVITRGANNLITVTGTIKNAGTGISTAFWTEAFYGLVDPQTGAFTPHGQIGGGTRSTRMGTGASTNITITGNIPNGSWVIGVIADSTDLTPETDETNNWFLYPI
ncbi:hypothetical protein CVU37_01630 [candidate division BRC1 bacterium HGW-BRC1-1]|nr:MAG: hypothetical protein CVU37_01630 [candidate division BRC1 bacterium HGW-BRC1-1]